jgi:hypothetical protein
MTIFRRNICLFIILSVVLICFRLNYHRLGDSQTWPAPVREHQHGRRPTLLLSPRVSCLGARGKLLNESIDDQLRAEELPVGKYDTCI